MADIYLTELERQAMIDLWHSSRGNGHDFGFPDDLPSIKKSSRGGVVGSLSKKDLITVYYDQGPGIPNQFKFTDIGMAQFRDFPDSPELFPVDYDITI